MTNNTQNTTKEQTVLKETGKSEKIQNIDSPKKQISYTNIILSLLTLIILFFGILAGIFIWQNSKPISTINVTGEAGKDITPDSYSINFGLEEKGNEISTLNNKVDQKTKDILEYLGTLGINKEQIKTNKSSYPNYTYLPTGENKENGEVVYISFEIKVENKPELTAKLNDITQKLTELGVTNINPTNYEISSEKRKQICSELEEQATKEAFDKAEKQIKNLGGGKIVRKQITGGGSTCTDGTVYPMYAAVSSEPTKDAKSSPEVMTGQQKIQASINLVVDYR